MNVAHLQSFELVHVLFVTQTMFQFVTNLMKLGHEEESTRQRHLALSPKDRPEKRNTAL